MNRSIQIFRVNDGKHEFHMTKSEIEEIDEQIKIISMLGYCPQCQNYSTETNLIENNIICVVCGNKRSLK